MDGGEYNERYIDEKFKGLGKDLASLTTLINARFENVDQQLDRVEGHAELTNSRVTHLEDENIIINRRIDETLTYIRHHIDTRPQTCPQNEHIRALKETIKDLETKVDSKFETIKNKLEDVFFVTKYPKLFLTAIVVAVLFSLLTLISNKPFSIFDRGNSINKVENVNQ